MNRLDRDPALQDLVIAFVDRAHATGTDRCDQANMANPGAFKLHSLPAAPAGRCCYQILDLEARPKTPVLLVYSATAGGKPAALPI
jgi:hypothetical protein